ncbi:hypothetical protein C8Q72DRAFT_881970 [Fomitopsis betulina]|nr:hypothetical protein C8Q72DRAFT_881970 [Fomitopsis betulina]
MSKKCSWYKKGKLKAIFEPSPEQQAKSSSEFAQAQRRQEASPNTVNWSKDASASQSSRVQDEGMNNEPDFMKERLEDGDGEHDGIELREEDEEEEDFDEDLAFVQVPGPSASRRQPQAGLSQQTQQRTAIQLDDDEDTRVEDIDKTAGEVIGNRETNLETIIDDLKKPNLSSGCTNWGTPVDNWQETNTYSVFTSSSFFEGSEPEPQHLASIPEYGSPSIPGSRAFSPTPDVSPVHLSPSFVPTTLPSDLLNLLEEEDIEELLAPSQEEAEESRLSPDLAYILESLPPPSVSEEVSDFFEFHILTSTMSDMKADSIPVLKKSSDYKVWSSQMLSYLMFIKADDALKAGDLTKPDYKKTNT